MNRILQDTSGIERRVRLSCYLALSALALIASSLVNPAPLLVIGAMSVGQVLGTLSLAYFVVAIVGDLRRTWVRTKQLEATGAPPDPPSPT